MGNLVKYYLARLIILTAASCKSFREGSGAVPHGLCSLDQTYAACHGFLWPKCFWDFSNKGLDRMVKPFPTLQLINLVLGIVGLCLEWPLKVLEATPLYRSILARIAIYTISVTAVTLLYQAMDPVIYYIISIATYLWAMREGEVSPTSDFNSSQGSLTSTGRPLSLKDRFRVCGRESNGIRAARVSRWGMVTSWWIMDFRKGAILCSARHRKIP